MIQLTRAKARDPADRESEIILDHRNNPQNTNRSTKWQTQ